MADVLARVQHLIALAADAPKGDAQRENEARNAALQACRLIREYKLVVVDPNGAQVRPHGNGVASQGFIDFMDLFVRPFADEFVRQAASNVGRRHQQRYQPPAQGSARPQPPPRRAAPKNDRQARIAAEMDSLKARAPGVPEEKIRAAATAIVDAEIAREAMGG